MRRAFPHLPQRHRPYHGQGHGLALTAVQVVLEGQRVLRAHTYRAGRPWDGGAGNSSQGMRPEGRSYGNAAHDRCASFGWRTFPVHPPTLASSRHRASRTHRGGCSARIGARPEAPTSTSLQKECVQRKPGVRGIAAHAVAGGHASVPTVKALLAAHRPPPPHTRIPIPTHRHSNPSHPGPCAAQSSSRAFHKTQHAPHERLPRRRQAPRLRLRPQA